MGRSAHAFSKINSTVYVNYIASYCWQNINDQYFIFTILADLVATMKRWSGKIPDIWKHKKMWYEYRN